MATLARVTQLAVEVLSSGTGDRRTTQLCVEVLSATENQAIRTTQLCVEVLQPSGGTADLLVTQQGVEVSQALDQVVVSQLGQESAQQGREVYVTQIGLEIISRVTPRGAPGGITCPEFYTVGADVVQACRVDFDPPAED